ncbi:hypothetical protein Nepgr_024647 [Nepenthes gracilis]|uniref:Rab-GAP TBC domain-containing protein n=1 Tax=Nepenthes gracilis TaxID=150966 RepID=A0AAD3T5K7_NEPGR|nr:hypothetical protein Nepgr_024647 [Nepenthes gracilis]
MVTEQKPLMRALRRSHTSAPSSTTPSSSSSSSHSSSPSSSLSSSSWIHLRSVLFVVASSSSQVSTDRGNVKSPWTRRKRKHALLPKQWKHLFGSDGKLSDGGVKFLKKVRSGGVDPSIRAEVWPFLLGVYDLNSSKDERHSVRNRRRKEYGNLRRQCHRILRQQIESFKGNMTAGGGDFSQVLDTPDSEDEVSTRGSNDGLTPVDSDGPIWDSEVQQSDTLMIEEDDKSDLIACEDWSGAVAQSLDSESSEEGENTIFLSTDEVDRNDLYDHTNFPPSTNVGLKSCAAEDFASWQRIIRLDAARANDEWILYSPAQAAVPEAKARKLAERVGLKDYENLEPYRIYHAARLIAILEAYALYDPEIGYCQGMSDLLSPILSVVEEDHEAFWCFVGFMKKARHNFRLDEEGIKRQLGIISKIIKCKDSHLYSHLENLQAEDCFFVYRMVVVVFRRELTFEQTLCLWEVMWSDQAAIRAGISKSARERMRLRAPPTDDLLLYAIAACVMQRRKLIIEKYSSMDEILRELNDLAGHLDVWKLLDDAHDLVATLHDKI